VVTVRAAVAAASGRPDVQARPVRASDAEVALGAAQFHRQPDQPLLGPVMDVAFEPAQRGRFGRHRGHGLCAGGIALPLQPGDPAVQRGRVRQQRLPQPGLGGDTCPRHQRQAGQQQQATGPGRPRERLGHGP
jgi:hypothetical protein